MCGIAGVYFHDPDNSPLTHTSLEKLVDQLLLGIEHRGHDATGFAAVLPSGELEIEKADLEAQRFCWWRSKLPEKPQSVLLHTRFATQGTPMNLDNNHPVRYNNAVMTHNGHIHNDKEIFDEEGLSRNAEVDSEVIAALFDKYGIDKAHIPLGKLDGGFAVAVADLRKPKSLVLAKGNSSPLFYYEATQGIVWASTEQTIIDALKKSLNLEISRSEIDTLWYGQLLLLEDGKAEKLKFKVYSKPYAFSGTTVREDSESESGWFNQSWRERIFGGKKDEKEEKEDETQYDSDNLHKTDPLHVEFWENEKHNLEYKVTSGSNVFLFKKCDGCQVTCQTTLLTIIHDDSILCSRCLKEHDENNPEEENPAVVHEVVIEMVAERFATNPDFVNWMLFESENDEIDDTNLVSMYIQFEEEYNKIHKEFTGEDFGAANHWIDYAEEKDMDEAWTSATEEDEEIIGCGVEVFGELNAGEAIA